MSSISAPTPVWCSIASAFRYLHGVGQFETDDDAAVISRRVRIFYLSALAVGVVFGVLVLLAVVGVLGVRFVQVATSLGYLIVAFAVIYFAYLYLGGGYGKQDKRRIIVICQAVLASCHLLGGFRAGGFLAQPVCRGTDQQDDLRMGDAGHLAAERQPHLHCDLRAYLRRLWTTLAARHRNPSIPTKFALGLLGLSAGFFVIAWGASFATEANPVSPAWWW